MFDNAAFASSSLSMRPATAMDTPFLERLYRSARPDLQLLDSSQEQRDALVAQQYGVLQAGTAANHPHAMHFVVGKQGSRSAG